MTDKFGKQVGIGNTIILLALVSRAPSADTIIANLIGSPAPRDALRLCPQEVMLVDADVFVQVPPPGGYVQDAEPVSAAPRLPSRFQIGDSVGIAEDGKNGKVVGVYFRDGEVSYDVEHDVNGSKPIDNFMSSDLAQPYSEPVTAQSAGGPGTQEKAPGEAFQESQDFQKGETDGFDGRPLVAEEENTPAYLRGHAVGVASRKQKDAAEAELNSKGSIQEASKDTPPPGFVPPVATPAPVAPDPLPPIPAPVVEGTQPPPAEQQS